MFFMALLRALPSPPWPSGLEPVCFLYPGKNQKEGQEDEALKGLIRPLMGPYKALNGLIRPLRDL